MQPPDHSPAAIAKHPAPVREMYFTGTDYAAACMRTHDKRIAFDSFKVTGKMKNSIGKIWNKQGKI